MQDLPMFLANMGSMPFKILIITCKYNRDALH